MSKFTSTFNRFAELPEKVVRGSLISLSARIIERSPVDSGRFRGNWQITVNSPATKQLSNKDKKGKKRKAAIAQKINSYKESQNVFYLTNNLPYGERLEFGWSKQAPNGMVRRTLSEFDQLLQQEVKKT